MADVNANIGVNIDTSNALAQLKALQRQISQFHTSIAKSSESAALAQRDLQRNFINGVNAIGAFSAELRTIKTTSESFTDALEKNKFSMREYFRFAGASTKTFGKLFRSEFDTINKVAEENVKRLQTQYIKMGRDASGAMRAIAIMPNELDMSKMSTQLQMAAQRQALFNQLVKQGSTNLLNFGKNTQWAGRQLMVGFTLPLASLGTIASRTFMDMETAALKFRKVYGDLFTPASEREQALADIGALGEMFTKYGISVASTVGLAAEAAAAGFQGLDLQRQTTQATRLSVLGQIEQQKALETTISLQNAFKMSSEDLAGSIDFLNAVENQTVVSLDDITTAIPKVAPVIQQLGGDVKDLAFFMAAMKEGGVNASEGANALKSGLAALINPTEKAAEMLASMGINIKQIVETNRGDLKGTVIDFARALDTLEPLTRARAIEQLFGKFQFARLSTLFDNVTNQTGQAARVLDLAGTSIEELASLSESELGMTADSAMNKFRKSVEDLRLALVPVGQSFLEAITPIVEFLGGILEKFNNLSSGVKKAITIITVAIGAIGPIALMTFGLIANGAANLIKGFLVLRNGYLRLTGQSQILSEQTEFLTVEQQRAAAVAHSLDQSHARLTQTFNAEAGAVRALANEYRSALGVLQNFASRNPGMMLPPKPKKFASGGEVFAVPGTGNSDTVPAMLTPGEIVIPKRQSKKYGSLIQGIIADNIPGYKKGNFGETVGTVLGGRFMQRRFSPIAMMAPGNTASGFGMDPEWLQLNQEAKASFASALKTAGMAQAGIKQTADSYNNFWQGLNPVLDGIFDIFKSGISDEITTVAQLGEKQYPQMAQHIQELQQNSKISAEQAEQLSIALRKLVAPLASDKTQTDIKRIELALNEAGQTVVKRASYERFGETLKEQAVRNFPRELAQRGLSVPENIGEYSFAHIPQASAELTYVDPFLRKKAGAGSAAEQKVLADLKKGASFKEGQVVAEAAIEGARQGAATASPSKKTIPIGEDIARGISVGMINQEDDVARAGQQVAAGAVRGVSRGARTNAPVTPGTNFPIEQTRGGVPLQQVANAAIISQSTQKSAEVMVESAKSFQDRMTGLNRGLMSGTFALGSLAGIASFSGGKLGEFSGVISKLNLAMFALMSVTQLLTQQQFLALAAKRAETVGLLTSIAGTNKFKIANGLFAGGIKKLIPNLLRFGGIIARFLGLTNPVGIAITTLTAFWLITKKVNAEKEKERQAIYGLSEAMKVTAGQAKVLGDFFGVVTGKSAFESRAELRNREIVGKETRSERDRLRQDEGFQKEFKTQIQAFATATNEEATLAFQSLAIDLRSRGYAKEQVETIIGALREESKQTDVKFDVKSIDFSKESIDSIKTNLKGSLNELNKTYKTGFEKIFTYKAVGTDKGAQIVSVENIVPTKELQRKLANVSSYVATTAKSLATMFEGGIIDGKQYSKTLSTISGEVFGLDKAQRTLVLTKVFKELNVDAGPFLQNLYTAKQQMMAIALISAGLIDKESSILKALGSEDPKTRSRGILQLTKLYDQYFGAIEKVIKGEGDLKGAGDGKKALLADEIKALKNQIEAYKQLRIANIDAATAAELAGNAEMAALLAVNGAVKANISAIRQYRDLKKELAKLEMAGASAGDYELARLNTAQKYIEVQEKLLDIQTSPKLKEYNDQLQFQDLILKSLDNRIKSISDAEITPRETLIKKNNYKLEQISLLEEQINEKYDKQEKTLSKIFELNKDILAVENSRISVADALTQGDIAAASQAMAALKAQQAESSQNRQTKALQTAREQQINALGRLELEKQNKIIQLQISAIQEKQIDALELAKQKTQDQIDALNEQVSVTEELLKMQKDSITYFGMTKQQISDATDLLEAAKNAGINIDVKENLTAFIAAAKGDTTALTKLLNTTVPAAAKAAFDELQKLRDSMDLSATITVTTDKDGAVASIEEVTAKWNALKEAADKAAAARTILAQFEIDKVKYDDFVTKISDIDARIQQMLKDAADILKDGIITDDELAKFAEKWGLALGQADKFLKDVDALFKTAVIDKTAIENFAKEWGIPYKAAEQYLKDANAYLLANNIDSTTIQAFADKWGIPYTAAEKYLTDANAYLLANEIDSTQIAAYAEKWNDPKNAFDEYTSAVTAGIASINKLDYTSPGNSAAGAWNSATSAANAYAAAAAAAAQAQRDLAAATAAAAAASAAAASTAKSGSSTSGATGSTGSKSGTGSTGSAGKDGVTYKTADAAKRGYELSQAANAAAEAYDKQNKLGPSANLGDLLTAKNKAQEAYDEFVKANKLAQGGLVKAKYMNMGGMMPYLAGGGIFKSVNTDTVPAMLSPGEFVMSRYAVDNYGVDKMKAINNGTYEGENVYNYNLNVNVKSGANADDIARTVISQIKQIDSQRIRGQRVS